MSDSPVPTGPVPTGPVPTGPVPTDTARPARPLIQLIDQGETDGCCGGGSCGI